MEEVPVPGEPQPDPQQGSTSGERRPPDADQFRDKLHSLGEIKIAIQRLDGAGNHAAAERFFLIAPGHALVVLEMALDCLELPLGKRKLFANEAIRFAELLLKIETEGFSSSFGVNLDPNSPADTTVLSTLLAKARNDINSTPVDEMTRTEQSWLPIVVRIGAALLATAVGAPLSAFAVGDPIIKETIKAGIAVTAGAVAAEAANYLVERRLTPSDPTEQMKPRLSCTPSDVSPPAEARPTSQQKRDDGTTLSTGTEGSPRPSHDPGRNSQLPSSAADEETKIPSHDPINLYNLDQNATPKHRPSGPGSGPSV